MPRPRSAAPAIVIRASKDGTPFYEAKWRHDGSQVKRRLGPAWLERDGEAGWRKRPGRTPPGWLDQRTVHVAAAEAFTVAERARESAAREEAAAQAPPVRQVAQEWLSWLENVRGAKPATVRDYRSMLTEPGVPQRGGRVSLGRIMAAFGDRPIGTVTTRDVSEWLAKLDSEKLTPRNVNKHRQTLAMIFTYATRHDTYALPANPVLGTDKRREAPPAALDFYEATEVEALARAFEAGTHRMAPNYRGRPERLSPDEEVARKAEDQQDAEFIRLLFFSGIRLGEALALRWSDVEFLPDLSGGVLQVRRAVSAGIEGPTKSRRDRTVPLARPAVEALARLGQRPDFLGPDDYVFANRLGQRLDGSALRRRYKRACNAAGLRPVKLHGLRHAAGSTLARSMPLVTVRDVLGHSDLATTGRYLHSKLDAAAIEAVNRAFGVDRSDSEGTGCAVDHYAAPTTTS